MTDQTLRLDSADPVIRLFLTAFLVTMSLGYAAGLYFVAHTTSMTPNGTVEEFRGNEDQPISQVSEIKYAKDILEMMNIIHTHVTSFALIYLSVGGVFLFSGFNPKLKAVLAVEPFAGTVLLFGSMAALRYFGGGPAPLLSWVMITAGALTTLCFVTMVALSLKDLWATNTASSDVP